MTTQREDEEWMRQALLLAERGRGRTRPNPVVGAIVVRNGRRVGSGYHRRLGGPHAEAHALEAAGARARGATLYVSLEPCCHQGRTPPCAPAIADAGVRRVVVPIRDPDPRVSGRGLTTLRRAGVEVTSGVLAGAARAANRGYFKRLERGLPYVTLKLATSLDGRVAPARGEARWISGVPARRAAHRLRARNDTIVVGAETVRRDDPELTVRGVRLPGGQQPLRVVVSSDLAVPVGAKLFSRGLAKGTVVAGALPRGAREASAYARRERALTRRGVEVWNLPRQARGWVALAPLARELVRRGSCDVLVEGGPTLAAAFADAGMVDELWLFVAPRFLGAGGRPWGFGERATSLARAWRLEEATSRRLGRDWLIQGRPVGGDGRVHGSG